MKKVGGLVFWKKKKGVKVVEKKSGQPDWEIGIERTSRLGYVVYLCVRPIDIIGLKKVSFELPL